MLQPSTYPLWISSIIKSRYFIISIAAPVICLILSPYAMNGFWGDDAANSQVRFYMERLHANVWDFSLRVFWHWLTVEGRTMAGFLHGYSLFYLFSDLQSLRLAQCFTVLLNIGLFAYILSQLGFKRNIIVSWAILFVGLFQISDALDPTAAFAFHYQFLAIQLFLPLILLLKWRKNQKGKYLIFAMILWFWSMMYYEINVIFLFIIGCFILKISRDRRALLQNLLIVAVPVILYGLLNYYLRSKASGASYQGSSFGHVNLFFSAYLKQLSSSLPLSFYLTQGYKEIGLSDLISLGLHSKLAWTILVLAAIIFYKTTDVIKDEVASVHARFETIVITIAMLLLPPILPAISERYQVEVGWGHGALPVYYQYFGASLVLLWMISRIKLDTKPVRVELALIIGIYLALNTMVNMQTVINIDAGYFRGPRELFIRQAREGLFQDVKNGDIVEITGTPHYVSASLIFEGCGKNVFVPAEGHEWFPEAPSPHAQRFSLSRNPSSGRYELARLSPATEENK